MAEQRYQGDFEEPAGFDRGPQLDSSGPQWIAALECIHDRLAQQLTDALSTLLRTTVEVRLAAVEQLAFGKLLPRLETPTCLTVLRASPLDGKLLLEISPSLAYALIDVLLGGSGQAAPHARRPLTEIEQRLIGRVTALFSAELKRAWSDVLDLDVAAERMESNPRRVAGPTSGQSVAVVRFEVEVAASRGCFNLCVPLSSIEPIGDRLCNHWLTRAASLRIGSPGGLGRAGTQSAVELVVEVAQTKVNARDLLGLSVGDIITTEKDAADLLDVRVAGALRFRAAPGALNGSKAIQIEELRGCDDAGLEQPGGQLDPRLQGP